MKKAERKEMKTLPNHQTRKSIQSNHFSFFIFLITSHISSSLIKYTIPKFHLTQIIVSLGHFSFNHTLKYSFHLYIIFLSLVGILLFSFFLHHTFLKLVNSFSLFLGSLFTFLLLFCS